MSPFACISTPFPLSGIIPSHFSWFARRVNRKHVSASNLQENKSGGIALRLKSFNIIPVDKRGGLSLYALLALINSEC
jgi:hypothetical protein